MKEKKKIIWGRYDLKTEDTLRISGGEKRLSVKRMASGWMISENTNEEIADDLKLENNTPFSSSPNNKIFQTGDSEILQILPALPTKPVVLKNNKNIKISPKHSLKIYLGIPLNVQFYYRQIDDDHLMDEFPLKGLSDTWFGDPDNGEPAFSLGDRGSLSPEHLNLKPYEIICPVIISNQSTQFLDLHRLIIRVENLAIYYRNEQLISSLSNIDFKGSDRISNLYFTTDKALHGENPQQIARARGITAKTLLSKSFHFIKNFTQ